MFPDFQAHIRADRFGDGVHGFLMRSWDGFIFFFRPGLALRTHGFQISLRLYITVLRGKQSERNRYFRIFRVFCMVYPYLIEIADRTSRIDGP